MRNIIINSEDLQNILIDAFGRQLKDSYASPARNVVDRVFEELSGEYEEVLREVLKEIIADKKFKEAVKEEFRHKVAKLLVSDLSGSVEKAVNKFRQDSTLKARMILAIENIIDSAEDKS